MKNTKLFTLLFCMLAIFCSISFTSCEDHEEEYRAEIVGTWQLRSAYSYVDNKKDQDLIPTLYGYSYYTMEFRENNRYYGTLVGSNLGNAGKWKIYGNTLDLTDDSRTSMSFTMTIKDDELSFYDYKYENGHSYKTEYIYTKL